MEKGIVFRRIRGRVVPIKDARKKDAIEGVALASAGVGVSAAAGKAYRKMVSTSVGFSSNGWKAMEKLDALRIAPLRNQTLFAAKARAKGAFKIAEKADEAFAAGVKAARFAPAVRLGGLAIGSLLVGAGVSKFYSASTGRHDRVETGGIGTAAATGAFLTGAFGAAGFRQSIKGLYKKAYPAVRALKLKYRL